MTCASCRKCCPVDMVVIVIPGITSENVFAHCATNPAVGHTTHILRIEKHNRAHNTTTQRVFPKPGSHLSVVEECSLSCSSACSMISFWPSLGEKLMYEVL